MTYIKKNRRRMKEKKKKIKHNMLCMTGVYLRKITNIICLVLQVNVSHLSDCSHCIITVIMVCSPLRILKQKLDIHDALTSHALASVAVCTLQKGTECRVTG